MPRNFRIEASKTAILPIRALAAPHAMRRRWTKVQVTLRPLHKTQQIAVCDTGGDVATTLVGNNVAAWRLRRAGPGQDASRGDRICASPDTPARTRHHPQPDMPPRPPTTHNPAPLA